MTILRGDGLEVREEDRGALRGGRRVQLRLERELQLLEIVVEGAQQLGKRLDERLAVFLQVGGAEEHQTQHLGNVGGAAVGVVDLE